MNAIHLRTLRAPRCEGAARVRDKRRRWAVLQALAAVCAGAVIAGAWSDLGAQVSGRFAGDGIVIGLEYAVLDNPRLVAGMATAFAETGMPGMKHYVEAVDWGTMQRGADQPIDFAKMDLYVREYQQNGFSELTLSLKPHSRWASVDVRLLSSTNGSPKPEYRGLFQDWVRAVVERYDGDGVDDMPSLRWPVRYVEIGNEFSSYQPEPVQEYLETLRLAYEAAHAASDDVLVGHAAFLVTPVDMSVDPSRYEETWETTRRVDEHHGLEDLRAVLDRPELFDFINLHNLGSPYEIEDLVRWLKYETGLRGYEKPVVISDTLPTSYVGWGPADTCTGAVMGLVAYPAKEEDRCRLAEFFKKLIAKDRATLAWTRGFVAADHVQRAIVAAEQGIRVINLAFTGDISFLTMPFSRAGAGISAWGGAIRVNMFTGRVLERYPAFYAIKQLMGHLSGYESIERIATADPRARVYRLERADGPVWVAWLDPKAIVLPDDPGPSEEFEIEIGADRATLAPVITGMGQSDSRSTPIRGVNGRITVMLSHTPVYVVPMRQGTDGRFDPSVHGAVPSGPVRHESDDPQGCAAASLDLHRQSHHEAPFCR